MSFLSIEGCHAFVTGSRGGIGSAIVEEFLGTSSQTQILILLTSLSCRLQSNSSRQEASVADKAQQLVPNIGRHFRRGQHIKQHTAGRLAFWPDQHTCSKRRHHQRVEPSEHLGAGPGNMGTVVPGQCSRDFPHYQALPPRCPEVATGSRQRTGELGYRRDGQ